MYTSKNERVSQTSFQLTIRAFETLLEASIHSVAFWNLFLSHLRESTLLQDLILDDANMMVRKNSMKLVVNKCTFIPRLVVLLSLCRVGPSY